MNAVVNHAAPMSGVMPSGGPKRATIEMAAKGAPTMMYGRRRPHRERVRSESQPIRGSVMASKARASTCAKAMKPMATPMVSE